MNLGFVVLTLHKDFKQSLSSSEAENLRDWAFVVDIGPMSVVWLDIVNLVESLYDL